MKVFIDFFKEVLVHTKNHTGDIKELLAYLAVTLTIIFMTVGWTANIVKIFLADTAGEVLWRIMAALIFPIGAFYGYL